MLELGAQPRRYVDWWGSKMVLCRPCFEALKEDNAFTIHYPAYTEGACEQCGCADEERPWC